MNILTKVYNYEKAIFDMAMRNPLGREGMPM